jgi:hypothetical protein
MRRVRMLIGLLLAVAPWAGAQTADQATKDLIERLLARIDSLEARVAQIENPGAHAAAPAAPQSAQAVQHEHDTPPAPDAAQPVYPALKISGFSGELSLTARSDAGTGTPPATGFNAEVERLIIRYDFNDYFKVSFGRYHTPINYWNTAFHHGQWLQTTASRPETTQFGGSFIRYIS